MRGALSLIQSILTLQHQNEMTLCLELKDILFSLCIWELNIFGKLRKTLKLCSLSVKCKIGLLTSENRCLPCWP